MHLENCSSYICGSNHNSLQLTTIYVTSFTTVKNVIRFYVFSTQNVVYVWLCFNAAVLILKKGSYYNHKQNISDIYHSRSPPCFTKRVGVWVFEKILKTDGGGEEGGSKFSHKRGGLVKQVLVLQRKGITN